MILNYEKTKSDHLDDINKMLDEIQQIQQSRINFDFIK